MEKCPKCGHYMEEGYLITSGTLFSRNKHHPFLFLEPGDVRIIPMWGMGRRPALYCRDCELMIFLPNKKGKADRNSL